MEGAPYSLFAPMASQVVVQPYLTGIVGPNNTIELVNLPDGEYRLVVNREGLEPLEFMLDIVPGVREIVLQMDEVDTEEPQPTSDGGTAPDATSTESSSDQASSGSSVMGLPSTGAGEQSGFSLQLATLVALAGLAIGIGVNRTKGLRI